MNPTISVLMSVHNQANYLAAAITSILNQSFSDFEFIIVNDASTDTTSTILHQFKDSKIKLFTNSTHQGLAQSLNFSYKKSRGQFIARMDADDIAYPHRLKIQLDYLIHHLHIAVCGTAVDLINSAGKKIGQKHYPTQITSIMLMRFNPIIHPSAMIRKSVLTSTVYDPKLNGAEDYDLWLRLGSRHQLANLNQVLLAYRVNPQGVSWGSLKHTELQSIKARFKALSNYNYPFWHIIFLIKPILSHLIPGRVKKLLFNIS